MTDDKYLISEAPEGNMPADGLDTPRRKATTITVKAFFNGYKLAGMDGQEFAQLTPGQQLQARTDFLHDRASHIAGLPAGQVRMEAARMVCSLDAAQAAVEAGDISNAAMHFLDAGRFMERVTSSQLAGLSLKLENRPRKANEAKISKLETAQNQVIKLWLSQPRGRGEAERFSDTEAARLNFEGQKITSNTIRKDWISKKGISEYQKRTK